MTLYERARRDVAKRGRLMLHARGIPLSPEALAGAMLEAERDFLIVEFLRKK